MSDEINPLSMEQRILRVMRKVLASVVRDATPRDEHPNFLSEQTIEDIRLCFELISIRERELAQSLQLDPAQPLYPDQPRASQPISFSKPAKADPQKN